MLAVGLGALIVVGTSVGIGVTVANMAGFGRISYADLLLVCWVVGALCVGAGWWNLSRRRAFSAMMERYGDEVRAEDLAEALHQTDSWRLGLRLAELLWRGGAQEEFGLVWLTGQCGRGSWMERYRVLRGMEGSKEVLAAIRKANREVAFIGSFVWTPIMIMPTLSNVVTSLAWQNEAERNAKGLPVKVIVLCIVLSITAYSVFQYFRIGREREACVGFLSRLSDNDLGVLVGKGRLGRIAHGVLLARAVKR